MSPLPSRPKQYRARKCRMIVLSRELRLEHEVAAVPGRFFEMPGHFRIGMGVDSGMFREGLKRIGETLAYLMEAI